MYLTQLTLSKCLDISGASKQGGGGNCPPVFQEFYLFSKNINKKCKKLGHLWCFAHLSFCIALSVLKTWWHPCILIFSRTYILTHLTISQFLFSFLDDVGELRLSHSARGWGAKRPSRKRRRVQPPSLSWARATLSAVWPASSSNGRPLSK